MNKLVLIPGILVLAFTLRLDALSSRTAPQQLTWLLQYSMELCLSEGAQVQTITMPMLKKHLSKDVGHAFPLPFEDMFQLMDQQRVIDPVNGEQLVAVTSMRVMDRKHPDTGRYMLWWNGQHFRPDWQTEDKATEILRAAGLSLVNRGTWQTLGVGLPYDSTQPQYTERSPEEQREWLIRTRIEDGHDFGKPKLTREEVIRQLEAEGLIEKTDSRWPAALGLAALGALLALLWWWKSSRLIKHERT